MSMHSVGVEYEKRVLPYSDSTLSKASNRDFTDDHHQSVFICDE